MLVLKSTVDEEQKKVRVYTEEMSMSWTFKSVLQAYAVDAILKEIGHELALSDIAILCSHIKKQKLSTLRDASIFVYEFIKG